jgi:glycosyltransferase involved in cell wall biosynthesis
LEAIGTVLRILHLIQSLITGGAQRQLIYLAREQVKSGHDVHIAVLDGGELVPDLLRSGAKMHSLRTGALNHARGPGLHNYDLRLIFRLNNLVRTVNPDVTQTWIAQMDVLGGIASYLAGRPWILREPASSLAYDITLGIRLKAFARRWIARSAAGLVANSPGGVEYWAMKLPRRPRYLIPNGIPIEEIDAIPKGDAGLVLPESEARVLYVGRMDDGKNVVALVRAAAQLLSLRPAAQFVLCGEGASLSQIRRQISDLGLEGTMLTPGNVVGVWGIMKQANVFVSVSRYEGIPNAVMEAMACGCPLIVSDIPEHRAFLAEDSALFVPAEDHTALAAAIQTCLTDPEAAAARARRARQRIEKFSVGSMASLYDEVYREVLARRAGRTLKSR